MWKKQDRESERQIQDHLLMENTFSYSWGMHWLISLALDYEIVDIFHSLKIEENNKYYAHNVTGINGGPLLCEIPRSKSRKSK